MKKFDRILTEELEALPVGSDVKGKLDEVLRLKQDLDEAQNRVAEIESNLRQATEDYNFALGVALRKRLPQVTVDFANGRCATKYKSTNLSCHPDLQNKMWSFDNNQHGKKFSRRNAHVLRLSNQLDPLVDAMVDYLTNRYRSLG